MVDNQEMLKKIKADFAARCGISEDEASEKIDNTIGVVVTSVAEAFKVIADAIKVVAGLVKEVVMRVMERLKNREENESSWGWNVDWDTRRKSLVISNRPRFMVRKIIR